MWIGCELERAAGTHSMEPLKLLRKNGSISVPQSPTRRPQPPPLATVSAVWMMGGPRLVFTRDDLFGSASGPVGSLGREPPAHIRMPPSSLLRSSGPGSDIAFYTGTPAAGMLAPWLLERPLAAGVVLSGKVRAGGRSH